MVFALQFSYTEGTVPKLTVAQSPSFTYWTVDVHHAKRGLLTEEERLIASGGQGPLHRVASFLLRYCEISQNEMTVIKMQANQRGCLAVLIKSKIGFVLDTKSCYSWLFDPPLRMRGTTGVKSPVRIAFSCDWLHSSERLHGQMTPPHLAPTNSTRSW